MSQGNQDTPRCINCDEPMQPMQTAPSGPHFAPAWYCGNPDCPESGSDIAPMAEGEAEEWLNRPGTEGGANGGA